MQARASGILLPVFSLPGPYGIGTLGAPARSFIDFLAQAGQKFWQILPLVPPGGGDSPYMSPSSFAGNPFFLDLEELNREGLLTQEELDAARRADPDRVDYAWLHQTRIPLLRRAWERGRVCYAQPLAEFMVEEADWLPDYALFLALRERFGGKELKDWPDGIRLRHPSALARYRAELADECAFHAFLQLLFFRQWTAVKAYANGKGISIIGDLPIYVSGDSADVWSHPEQFQLDGEGRPTEVAGCPPDGFSADGQLWGNPLFDWERMEADGYRWWIRRIAFQFRIYDTLRIDHFRGFDAYYAVPFGETSARNGRWRPGPGIRFFEAVERALGPRDIIAEDLGFLTDSVRRLLAETGYPGMKVLEFAFDSRDTGGGYLPHCYTPHCVAYTGTHDNDTIRGWMSSAPAEDAALARAYLRLNEEEGFHWGMMRSAWASVAELAVMQFQDLLGLGSEARMNIPSTLGGNNWRWRTAPGTYGEELARRLRREMEIYQRLPR